MTYAGKRLQEVMITPYPAPHLNPLFQSVMLAFYKLFFKISLISSLSLTYAGKRLQEVYSLLGEADMLVIASPIYYHGVSGQLKCAHEGCTFQDR